MFQCVSNQHRERESSKSNTYVSAQLRTTSLVRESEACPQIQRQTEMLLLKFDYFLSLSLSLRLVFLLCLISRLHIFRPDITECPPAECKIRLSLKNVQSVLVTLTARKKKKKAREDFNRHALKTNLPASLMFYLCRFVTDKHVCRAVWRQLTWN